MAYEVPPLPYDYAALEPHIDEQTMRIHHDKHHQAYVDKANAALEGTDFADKPIEEVLKNLDALPADKQKAVRNNGGGHYNHSLFWEMLSPDGGGAPDGDLGAAIDAAFGSFDDFKAKFKEAGDQPVRLRLGVARARRLGSGHHQHPEPGHAALRRPDAAAGRRRVGARVLPQVPEQAPRLPRRVLERGQLGQGLRALRGRVIASRRNSRPAAALECP